jgi:hypothetical protein
VAILFAREGADITIVFLPEEEKDAEGTRNEVLKAGSACLVIPGNLMDNATCKTAVERHIKE